MGRVHSSICFSGAYWYLNQGFKICLTNSQVNVREEIAVAQHQINVDPWKATVTKMTTAKMDSFVAQITVQKGGPFKILMIAA